MCYKGFLEDKRMQLPLKRENANQDFSRYLEHIFDEYKSSADDNNIVHKQGDKLCKGILEAIKKYLDGFPNEAYNELHEVMKSVKSVFEQIRPETKSGHNHNVRLYRMRIGYHEIESRKDIFHIPFEKRHLISTQRYSIPGYPCLYLSGSLYTCWQELGRPDWLNTSISAFRVAENKTVKFLDMSYYVPQVFLKNPTYNPCKAKDCVHIWPLLAACYIKCLHPNGNFKHEYIIPQLLLQWVRKNHNHDYDGIKYLSTHIPNISDNNPHWYCNFVVPVKKIQEYGICTELREKFILTDPNHWQIIRASGHELQSYIWDDFSVELMKGKPEKYKLTEFGQVQACLNGLINSIIDDRDSNTDLGKVEIKD